MSQEKKKRIYSRDYLLKFEKNSKPNPVVLEKMEPFIADRTNRPNRIPRKTNQTPNYIFSPKITSCHIKNISTPEKSGWKVYSPQQLDSAPFRQDTELKVYIPKTPTPPQQKTKVYFKTPSSLPTHSNKTQSKIVPENRIPLQPIFYSRKPQNSSSEVIFFENPSKTTFINKENVINESQLCFGNKDQKIPLGVHSLHNQNLTQKINSETKKKPFSEVETSMISENKEDLISQDDSKGNILKNKIKLSNFNPENFPIKDDSENFLMPTFSPENSSKFSPSSSLSPVTPLGTPSSGRKLPSPLDDNRLKQRQKQIDYGHRTIGYLRYRLLVPKEKRQPEHPRTPKKSQPCSKRSWDGQLRKWRRELHRWDPDDLEAFRSLLFSDFVAGLISSSPGLKEIFMSIQERGFSNSLDDDEQFLLDPPQQNQSNKKDSTQKESEFEKVARTLVF